MASNDNLHEEVGFVKNLQGLVTAYEEIAVMRIDRVRESVLAARNFYTGLSGVVTEVRRAHQEQIAALMNKKERRMNPKELSVLISTNTRLSGHVTPMVSRYFIEHIKEKQDSDVAIVGQVGKEHFMQLEHERKFSFFPLPNTQPEMKDLYPLIERLLQYQAVTLYFGSFQNVVSQEPAVVHLGDTAFVDGNDDIKKHRSFLKPNDFTPYIFEPSVEQVIKFFNEQILAILVKQTMDESWLSLLGSRITAMESSLYSIERRLKKLSLDEVKQRKGIQNRKQRDMLSGISLWKTT